MDIQRNFHYIKNATFGTVLKERRNRIGIDINGPCVLLEEDAKRFLRNSELPGVTVNISRKNVPKSPNDIVTLLQFVHYRFNRTEIALTRNLGSLWQSAVSLLETRTSPDLLIHFEYFVNLGRNHVHRGKLQTILPFLSHSSVKGIHFELIPEELLNKSFHDKLLFSLNLITRSGKKRGLVVIFEHNVLEEIHRGSTFPSLDYLIVDVDLAKELRKLSMELSENTISAHPFIKLKVANPVLQQMFHRIQVFVQNLKWLNKNMEVMIRYRWPTIKNSTKSKESVATSLRIWNYVLEFSEQIHQKYFINEAFDGQQKRFEGYMVDYGWWQSDNILQNASLLNEKYSDFWEEYTKKLNDFDTSYESKTVTNNVLHYYVFGAVIGALVLLSAIIAQWIRIQKQSNILSRREVQDFIHGIKTQYDGNITEYVDLKNEKYDTKYEINKEEIDLKKCKPIGYGNFGVVYLTKISRFDKEVALKMPLVSRESDKTHAAVMAILREIKVMSHVGDHENILQLLGVYTKELRRGIVYVVTEYCKYGSLKCFLKSSEPGYRDNIYEMYRFCQEIATGMRYLAGKKVVHGDLSTRNVLLNSFRTCKISDFGLSHKLEAYEVYVKENKGDPLPWKWMAIETLEHLEFTLKSDIWSMGVALWEIFQLGAIPYPGKKWNADFIKGLREGMRLPKPDRLTDQVYGFLLTCWNLEPSQRPSCRDVVQFFNQLRTNEYE